LSKVTREFFLVGLTVWNLIISWSIWRLIRHYRHLTANVSEGNLEKILERILDQGKLTKREIDQIKKELVRLSQKEKQCFQHVGLVKFNPFSDLGGNQSFSLAILDDRHQGLVITGLHGRQTTRVYAKLLNGKEGVKLSEEEQMAIKKATGKKGGRDEK